MPSLGQFTLWDEEKYFFYEYRTIGYGLVTRIKPAKQFIEKDEKLGLNKEDEKGQVEKQV